MTEMTGVNRGVTSVIGIFFKTDQRTGHTFVFLYVCGPLKPLKNFPTGHYPTRDIKLKQYTNTRTLHIVGRDINTEKQNPNITQSNLQCLQQLNIISSVYGNPYDNNM